jgi:hypothetical protein
VSIAKSLLQDDFGSPSHLAAQLLPYLRRFSSFHLFLPIEPEVPPADNTS